MIKNVIGKRLAVLRVELPLGSGEEQWTQARVAAETGLTTNQVARLEQSGDGSIEGLMKLLRFFQEKGHNMNWVLMEDNEMVSKLYVNEVAKDIDPVGAINALTALKTSFSQIMAAEIDQVIEKLTP